MIVAPKVLSVNASAYLNSVCVRDGSSLMTLLHSAAEGLSGLCSLTVYLQVFNKKSCLVRGYTCFVLGKTTVFFSRVINMWMKARQSLIFQISNLPFYSTMSKLTRFAFLDLLFLNFFFLVVFLYIFSYKSIKFMRM